ncbi:MAG: apolipoprotein N-acyltransferase [Candidatus Latescibacterota bacterium]|nr:MAG: apolipoprotein N-acyltransferase [Candidatus Latescibacterota bacterium]
MNLPPIKWPLAVPLLAAMTLPVISRRMVPPYLAAVVSGVLLALAYPPVSQGAFCFIAFVPVVVTLYRGSYRKAEFFRAGYLFGVTFFLAHLWWIVRLLPASSITMPWLMVPALIVLVAYLSVYPALFFLLLRVIGRSYWSVLWLIGPGAWTLLEWIRSNGELGFPWAAIGYSLAREPVMMQGASVIGVTGLGAFVVLVNMIVSTALLSKEATTKTAWIAVALIMLFLGGLYGKREMNRVDSLLNGEGHTVAVVQPNVDLALKWKPEFTDSTFLLIERLTRQAALSEPGVVVFPETCAPVYLRYDNKYRPRMETLARDTGVSVLIGYLDGRYDGPDGSLNVFNSACLITPQSRFWSYDKMHLLPFGEAIPFAWKFPWLSKINFGQANFTPGPDIEPFESSVGRLGPLICFESIFPEISRGFVRRGADVLVNVTNDGWFGDTPGPFQHNDMAILRAVENRRFLVRSANTGISMFVDPVGRVKSALGLDREGVLVDTIHVVSETTFYTRHGDTPVLVVMAAALIAGGVFADRRRRASRLDAV